MSNKDLVKEQLSLLRSISKRISSRSLALVMSVLLLAAPVLSGCVSGGPPPSPGPSTTTAPHGTTGGAASALPEVNSPFPGPYKIVEVDGVQMRQGRYPTGEFSGVLVRSLVGDPKVFNPWTSADTQSSELAGLMFAGLVMLDPYKGDVIPDLAESFTVEKDNLTYTVRLRKGLTWSDGKPITADDVVYTWNTIIAGGYGNSSLRDVTTVNGKCPTVTAIDPTTIKFVTPRPFAPFLRLLGMPITPKHIVKPIIDGKDGRRAFDRLWTVNSDPSTFVVNGPFKLKKYVPAQRVEFGRNDKYAAVNRERKRLPYLAGITYLIVGDPNTNLLKFRAKEIDLTTVRPRDVVELMGVREKENFQLYNLGQGIGTFFVCFNMNQRKNPNSGKPYVTPYKSVWFNDLNFRQAVNHAINRDQMVANYFKGIGFPLFTSEPPTSPYFNSGLKGFKPDVDYSMSLLEKSGFKKKDDGFLYDKDGHKVEFTMIASSGSTYTEAVGNMFKNDMRKLGMKVNLQFIDFNIMGDKLNNSLDWEACLAGLRAGDPLEPNDGANVYKANGRLHWFDQRLPDSSGEIKVTDARPWEKRLDEIFNTGAETLDPAKRKALYNEYQQIIYDQAPYIYLVSPMTIVAVRNTIKNYQPTFLSQSANGLHNLDEIWKEETSGTGK
ncbi:MAG TPA: ABC transporter substrate-binding protein [Candidatus Obscuribacterales bacterium]